jgi:hypothetical protein
VFFEIRSEIGRPSLEQDPHRDDINKQNCYLYCLIVFEIKGKDKKVNDCSMYVLELSIP